MIRKQLYTQFTLGPKAGSPDTPLPFQIFSFKKTNFLGIRELLQELSQASAVASEVLAPTTLISWSREDEYELN